MKRLLLKYSSFVRSAKRTIRKNQQAAENLPAVLELLSEDAFHPLLRTHKLKGNLEGSWACSVAYDLRIVFSIVDYAGSEGQPKPETTP